MTRSTRWLAAAMGLAASTAAAPGQESAARVLVEADASRAGPLAGELGLDVWSVHPAEGTMEIRVTPGQLEALREAGVDPEVLARDVYAMHERREAAPPAGGGEPWTFYHELEGAYALLEELHAAHPNTSALIEIGQTWEGRPIRGIRLGSGAGGVDDARPAVLITGCHHAREWISVEVPLYLAERLLDEYGEDALVTSILDRGEIWIVPVTNPDGFVYTQIDRFWRKNRRDNGDGTFGVDLNRNYGYEWGHGSGSSGNPGSDLYRGPAPFSEPETQAIRDLYLERDFAFGLTYHSYSQLVLSPWGYTYDPPPGSARMEDLMDAAAGAINGAVDNPNGPYIGARWALGLYLGSGIFVDWVYGEFEVPSAIVELRPRLSSQGGFELPAEQILPTCEENYAGALVMLEEVLFEWCPADCDRSTGNGVLDIKDFVCFQEAFLSGDDLADCDGDGALSVLDFVCFQEAFVAGCPWPEG